MKAPYFQYCKPATLEEALGFLQTHGDSARILAGGQSLLATLNLRLSSPDWLVDISGLPLKGIECHGDEVHIGALTTHREIEFSPEVRSHLPLLYQAAPHVAHHAIRSRGTLGGSLALADPAAEWPAVALALDAQFEIASRNGLRTVRASHYFKGLYETDLAPGEIIIKVRFPRRKEGERYHFLELARRHGDYAAAGIAAAFLGRQMRCALFGVGVMPLLYEATASASSSPLNDFLEHLAQMDIVGDLYFSPDSKRRLVAELFDRAWQQHSRSQD